MRLLTSICLNLLLIFFLLAGCATTQKKDLHVSLKALGVDQQLIISMAEAGDADAQAYLGIMYESGEGVPVSYSNAKKWHKKAAEQGHPQAQFFLARMYEEGKGGPVNLNKAIKWYIKAAEQGHEGALLLLADLCYRTNNIRCP